jgi:hypothetical protein
LPHSAKAGTVTIDIENMPITKTAAIVILADRLMA